MFSLFFALVSKNNPLYSFANFSPSSVSTSLSFCKSILFPKKSKGISFISMVFDISSIQFLIFLNDLFEVISYTKIIPKLTLTFFKATLR